MFIEALGIIVGLPKRLEAFRSVSKYTEVGGVTTLFFFFSLAGHGAGNRPNK